MLILTLGVAAPLVAGDAVPVAAAPPPMAPSAAQAEGVDVPPLPDCYPFVETGSSFPVGEIARGSEPLQLSFGAGDLVYVERFEEFPLAAGQRYEVVRDEEEFRHPESGDVLGRAASLRGEAEIVDVGEGRALARLRSVCMEVEPGDLLRPVSEDDAPSFGALPEFDFARLVSVRPDDAIVVMGFRATVLTETSSGDRAGVTLSRETYAQGDVLTIDRGREAGWAIGDVVLLYEDEPLRQRGARREADIPEVVARAVVFRVGRRTATVIVTDSVKAVSIGDRGRRIGRVEPNPSP